MAFTISSSAFAPNTSIPARYTCQGEDISPPLSWSDLPSGTKSLALIMDDPDATIGTWDHWIIINLPDTTTQLSEGTTLPAGAEMLKNSWGNKEYGGPCPPSGTHRYIFQLYALDTVLNPEVVTSKDHLLQSVQQHSLGEARLIGLYAKS